MRAEKRLLKQLQLTIPKTKMKILFSAFLAIFFISSAQAADIYKIDPTISSVSWKVSHFGFANVTGKFSKIEGTINLDEKNPQDSAVQVTIDMSSMNTGFSKLDDALAGAEFFNVAKFPKAEFKSFAINPSAKSAKIRGNLTLLGITKAINLEAKLNKIGINPVTQKKTVGFTAKSVFKRSDFGLKFGLPNIADKVEIEVEIEANLIGSTAENSGDSASRAGEWKIIPSKSNISFQAKQEDSIISGKFKKFSGKIIFDKNLLSKSSVEMNIDTSSIDMPFAEALATVSGSDWLAISSFPKAVFKADKFVALSTSQTFEGSGNLTIKGKTVPAKITFTFPQYDSSHARAEGSVAIKRSAFGIGSRDVKKSNGVADEVLINFVIEAEK